MLENDNVNNNNVEKLIVNIRKMVEEGRMQSYEPLLPLLLTLNGKPYTLKEHLPFATLFKVRAPKKTVVKSARQLSKTTSLAAKSILKCNSIPFYSVLFVTPLYEQCRRLSTNYIRPFIENSPVKDLFIGTNTDNSVLQRSFKNESRMIFSFALLDVDRVRGVSSRCNILDEIQDMDPNFLPIISETMSAAPDPITEYYGTPKSDDNVLEKLWQRSSMAEWFIPCIACKHWNIPSKEYDLISMIGPLRDDISIDNPAIICSKCKRPIDSRLGRWVHRHPHKRWDFVGYHIPQIIMPMHYALKNKWADLLGKSTGVGNYTKAKFFNEVLGESLDESTKLVNETDLKRASSLPWRNDPENLTDIAKKAATYPYRCLGIDWGAGSDDGVSFTTLALLGWKGDGSIDVLWGKRLLTPYDHMGEARECLKIFNTFKCHFLAHDYTGAGSLRETLVNQAGIPSDKIVPVAYCRTVHRDMLSLHAATKQHPRNYYLLDKARSLQLVCNCIKLRLIKFFQYDYVDDNNIGLISDFLSLIENKIDTAQAGDIYTIVRNAERSDDFSHAVNIGACTLWHATGAWPNLATMSHLNASIEKNNKEKEKGR